MTRDGLPVRRGTAAWRAATALAALGIAALPARAQAAGPRRDRVAPACNRDTPCDATPAPANDPANARFKAEPRLVGGIRRARLSALDAALARDGFSTLSPTRAVGGIGGSATFERVRVDFGVVTGAASSRNATDAEVSTWLTEADVTLGYELVRYHGLSVFAGAGIVYGWLRADAGTPGSALFSATLPDGERLQRRYAAIPLDLGTDLLLPIGRDGALGQAVAVGVHGGPLFQIAHGDWETTHGTRASVTGPDIDASGFRAELTIGWALYRARW